MDFAIDTRVAHPARNQLGNLRAEIDDKDSVVKRLVHGGALRRFLSHRNGLDAVYPTLLSAAEDLIQVGKENINRFRELFVDDVQISSPVCHAGQWCFAVGNPAQADERDAE
jgi:hypothetical protein